MKIDTFLKGGAGHSICQDYILSGMLPRPYIIISDGCSSSSNSETGARILSHLAKQYLRYRADYLDDLNKNEMGDWIAHNAEMIARQLGLPTSCLDATLIVAIKQELDVRVIFFGDGFAYGISSRLGTTMLDEVFYTNNAPYYLSYRIDPNRNELYQQMGNSVTVVTKHKGDIDPDPIEACYSYEMPISTSFPISEFHTVIVSSDGLASFLMPNPIDPDKRIKLDPMWLMEDHFSAFKNKTGEFLRRRCKRAIEEFEKKGAIHFDDFSMGAFLLED